MYNFKINKKYLLGYSIYALFVLLLILIFLLFLTNFSLFNKAYVDKSYDSTAIAVGRKMSYDLLYYFNPSFDENIKDRLTERAIEKIKHITPHQIYTPDLMAQFLIDNNWTKNKELSSKISWPITEYVTNKEYLELSEYQRNWHDVKMKFAYRNPDYTYTANLPELGPMEFEITLSYHEPYTNIWNKLASLPLIRQLTGEFGMTGKWYIMDFNYSYDIHQYFDWLKNNYEQTQMSNMQ